VAISSIRLGDDTIGPGSPTYVVAEMSGNHNGDYDRALELLRVAKAAGANAVKLQTYTPDTITLKSDDPLFRLPSGGLWGGRTLYDLYGEASMPWEWQPKLLAEAKRIGITLFSAPFDDSAVDFLEDIGVPAFKVASFEIVDLPLIERVARTGKPMFISTGMATLAEISEAVGAARGAGAREIVLLKCTSAYPADPADMNIAAIPHLAAEFGLPVGLSDHTLGIAVPVAAVALGACAIEKHYTLRRADGGPDSGFSLEPEELRMMIEQVRIAERAIGAVSYGAGDAERGNIVFRRSLFVVEDLKAGDTLTSKNVRSIRPGNGLAPKHLPEVLGRRAAGPIKRGTPLSWELIAR
jgi:N-acetylneuraminate synthase